MRVHLRLGVVDRLLEEAKQETDRPEHDSGILLGSWVSLEGSPVAIIEDYQSSASPEAETAVFPTSATFGTSNSGRKQWRFLGVYRLHAPVISTPSDADLELVNSDPSSNRVLLLIDNGRAPTKTAAFFFFPAGETQFCGDRCEFIFDRRHLGTWLIVPPSPRPDAAPTEAASPAVEQPTEVAEVERPVDSKGQNSSWTTRWWGGAFALGLLFGTLLWVLRTSVGEAAPADTWQPTRSIFQLSAERKGPDWKITWDGDANLEFKPVRGTLTIEEGYLSKIVPLDASALRVGHVLYSPLTNDIDVRMEVTDEDGEMRAGSVRILLGVSQFRPAGSELPSIRRSIRKSVSSPLSASATAAGSGSREGNTSINHVLRVAGPEPRLPVSAVNSRSSEKNERVLPPKLSMMPASLPGTLATPRQAPPRLAVDASRYSSGNVVAPRVISRVLPTLPAQVRIQPSGSTVVLRASIDKTGVVSKVSAVSGNALLVPAATEALRKWRYAPALVSGKPVEAEAEVRFEFRQ